MDFPPIIHMIWLDGLSQIEPWFASNMDSWREHNSGWTIRFWDREKIAHFLSDQYPAYLALWLDLDKDIKRCDMARYLILRTFGGVYADMDTTCIHPLASFLDASKVYNRTWTFPFPPEENELISEDICPSDFQVILSHEEANMCDDLGFPVSNAVMIAKPNVELFNTFVMESFERKDDKVLDSFGTRAFTRFIRQQEPKGILVIPPHYFLWEPYKNGESALPHTVSYHYYRTAWGDNRLRTRIKKRLGFYVKPWDI